MGGASLAPSGLLSSRAGLLPTPFDRPDAPLGAGQPQHRVSRGALRCQPGADGGDLGAVSPGQHGRGEPPSDPLPPPRVPLQRISMVFSRQSYREKELLRLVYFGGVQHEIRKSVWPFLLGHYRFGMLEAERKEVSRVQNIYASEFCARIPWRGFQTEPPFVEPCLVLLWGSLGAPAVLSPVSLADRWTCRPAPTTSKPWLSGWAARPSSGSGRRSRTPRPWPSAPRGPAWSPRWGP